MSELQKYGEEKDLGAEFRNQKTELGTKEFACAVEKRQVVRNRLQIIGFSAGSRPSAHGFDRRHTPRILTPEFCFLFSYFVLGPGPGIGQVLPPPVPCLLLRATRKTLCKWLW
jgi:hypothetical protein